MCQDGRPVSFECLPPLYVQSGGMQASLSSLVITGPQPQSIVARRLRAEIDSNKKQTDRAKMQGQDYSPLLAEIFSCGQQRAASSTGDSFPQAFEGWSKHLRPASRSQERWLVPFSSSLFTLIHDDEQSRPKPVRQTNGSNPQSSWGCVPGSSNSSSNQQRSGPAGVAPSIASHALGALFSASPAVVCVLALWGGGVCELPETRKYDQRGGEA